eukprot:6460038-Alexandrium_andersonii.AAC.1
MGGGPEAAVGARQGSGPAGGRGAGGPGARGPGRGGGPRALGRVPTHFAGAGPEATPPCRSVEDTVSDDVSAVG